MAGRLILLLGGARSGKSRYAETWAQEHGRRVLFVATAQAFDDEMRHRIARHRADRPANWTTVEAPLDAAAAIRGALTEHDTVLIDCITLLASNVLLAQPEDAAQDAVNRAVLTEIDALLAVRAGSAATWLVVSNEVGMGVVPPTRLGRYYRDALGYANQRLAQAADEVLVLVAGLPWHLKGDG
jgi:adenosylcobinamide kinase/adenosylcobinamide-phosphate guanylyltransferase